jgi:predicted permease
MPSLLLQSLFPLVFIMLLGWLSGKLGYSRREDANVMATVVIRFALPFHLFRCIAYRPNKIKNLTFMAVLVVGLMGSYLLTLFISRTFFATISKPAPFSLWFAPFRIWPTLAHRSWRC